MSLWPTLVEFLLRLSTGLAAAMLITPAQWVTSGFFRVHLWVLLGLGTLTALAIYSQWSAYDLAPWALGLTIAAASLSYVGAVVWMYDARLAGKVLLALVMMLFASADTASDVLVSNPKAAASWANQFDFVTGAAILGTFLAAMLLGHWYLNNPGMKLEPLRLLVILCGLALMGRAMLCAYGLFAGEMPATTIGWSFIAFRWLAGLVGPTVMAWLTWETLKIPNTQSATGILYAAVTLTFLGELTSQLLSRGLPLPV